MLLECFCKVLLAFLSGFPRFSKGFLGGVLRVGVVFMLWV